jgi:hypothetical protein
MSRPPLQKIPKFVTSLPLPRNEPIKSEEKSQKPENIAGRERRKRRQRNKQTKINEKQRKVDDEHEANVRNDAKKKENSKRYDEIEKQRRVTENRLNTKQLWQDLSAVNDQAVIELNGLDRMEKLAAFSFAELKKAKFLITFGNQRPGDMKYRKTVSLQEFKENKPADRESMARRQLNVAVRERIIMATFDCRKDPSLRNASDCAAALMIITPEIKLPVALDSPPRHNECICAKEFHKAPTPRQLTSQVFGRSPPGVVAHYSTTCRGKCNPLCRKCCPHY